MKMIVKFFLPIQANFLNKKELLSANERNNENAPESMLSGAPVSSGTESVPRIVMNT